MHHNHTHRHTTQHTHYNTIPTQRLHNFLLHFSCTRSILNERIELSHRVLRWLTRTPTRAQKFQPPPDQRRRPQSDQRPAGKTGRPLLQDNSRSNGLPTFTYSIERARNAHTSHTHTSRHPSESESEKILCSIYFYCAPSFICQLLSFIVLLFSSLRLQEMKFHKTPQKQ